MVPMIRRDGRPLRAARRPLLRSCLLALLAPFAVAGCSGEAAKLGDGAQGAAGLSSVVRDGALKDPFRSSETVATAESTPTRDGSPDLKDPFSHAPQAPGEGSAAALKNPFAADAPRAKGDAGTAELKDPFAAPSEAAGASSGRGPQDPFAGPAAAHDDDGDDGRDDRTQAIEPTSGRPRTGAQPAAPRGPGTRESEPSQELKDPFADG